MDTQSIVTKSTDHKSLQTLMNYKYNTVSVHNKPFFGLSRLSFLTGSLLIAIILFGIGYILVSGLVLALVIGFLLSKIK